MPLPVLIDTDMGLDDAVAITLALMAEPLRIEAIVAVGGNVPLLQASRNVGRLLAALQPQHEPAVGLGLDQQDPNLLDARHVFGKDGLGETDWPVPEDFEPAAYTKVYREAIERHPGELVVVCIGPLTNLAALRRTHPALLRQVAQIVVMGGALWCRGNVRGVAEFNFYRDPEAAEQILSSGLPVTLVPLDVTQFVQMDESHLARLAASSHPAAQFLAEILRWPIYHDSGRQVAGKFIMHDALAVGSLIWPELFLSTRLPIRVETSSSAAGKCVPLPRHDKSRPPVTVLTTVGAMDLLENILEVLCGERFVV